MQQIHRRETVAERRGWYFACVDDADVELPGLTFVMGTLLISKAGGPNANAVNFAAVVEIGNGMYWYPASIDEVNRIGPIGFTVNKAGVRLVLMAPVQVVRRILGFH